MDPLEEVEERIKLKIKELDELFGVESTKIDRNLGLSKELPKEFKVLSKEDNIERIKVLSNRIENNIATDEEWEEYGWRIVTR